MDFNWLLILPLIFIQLILLTFALVDLNQRERVNGPKWLWIVIIVVVNIIGPILYFVVGRRDFS